MELMQNSKLLDSFAQDRLFSRLVAFAPTSILLDFHHLEAFQDQYKNTSHTSVNFYVPFILRILQSLLEYSIIFFAFDWTYKKDHILSPEFGVVYSWVGDDPCGHGDLPPCCDGTVRTILDKEKVITYFPTAWIYFWDPIFFWEVYAIVRTFSLSHLGANDCLCFMIF
ncbi:hypothetical protein ACJX0J_005979 [Zea mays]